MANDRSKNFFNVLALENILEALTREIGDGPCFLYIKFSWIGVPSIFHFTKKNMREYMYLTKNKKIFHFIFRSQKVSGYNYGGCNAYL